jgi:hypothetical protein
MTAYWKLEMPALVTAIGPTAAVRFVSTSTGTADRDRQIRQQDGTLSNVTKSGAA